MNVLQATYATLEFITVALVYDLSLLSDSECTRVSVRHNNLILNDLNKHVSLSIKNISKTKLYKSYTIHEGANIEKPC